MRARLGGLVAALSLVAPAVGAAQETPDLSGTWVLVVERSDFGGAPAPAGRKDVIEHREPALTIQRTIQSPGEPDVVATLTYSVDGKPHRNAIGGTEVASTLRWEGQVLVMESNVPTPQGEAAITDRLSLSPDGQTLTMQRGIAVQGQQISQTMVFAKQ